MKQGLFILAVMVLALVVRRVFKAAMPFVRSAQPRYVLLEQ